MKLVRHIRQNLTYANVVSTIALLAIVSGGTAYAASTLITGRQIASNTVTGANVRNGTLGAADLSARTRLALRGPQGIRGLQGLIGPPGQNGAAGPAGPAGLAGTPGVSGWEIVSSNTGYATTAAAAVCPAGKRVLGGGAYASSGTTIYQSYPAQADRWYATASNGVIAYAICANVS